MHERETCQLNIDNYSREQNGSQDEYQMKMTAVTIKFCIYVFLVENENLFTNKTISPSEEKKKNKQLLFFSFQTSFFSLKQVLQENLFSILEFCFYQLQITFFWFNFHISSFQAHVFARIYASLYIKEGDRCTPTQPYGFFSERLFSAAEISPEGNPAVGAVQNFCVGASYTKILGFQPPKPSWGVAQRRAGPFLSLIVDISEMQVREFQTSQSFAPGFNFTPCPCPQFLLLDNSGLLM